jgi:hypothetical protein
MIDDVVKTLRGYRLPTTREDELQAAVARALTEHGFDFHREEVLDAKAGRIDFVIVGRHVPPSSPYAFAPIGLECKVKGSPSVVVEQLLRYSATHVFTGGGLILLTSRHTHAAYFRDCNLNGVPFRIITLGLGQL